MTILKDELSTHSVEQLKSALQAEKLLRKYQFSEHDVTFEFGETGSIENHHKQVEHKFGHHVWYSDRVFTNYTLPETWYDDVYLEGIGCVLYKNKMCFVFEAEQVDESELRADFQGLGYRVHKVKIANPIKINWHQTFELEERYVVSTTMGDEIYAFAAVHMNAAASNVKKKAMAKMEYLMGL